MLYAMNLYFTAALLPTIVADIGDAHLFAWVATGFLVAAVVSSMLVARAIASFGSRGAYLLGFGCFAAGSAAAAVSADMGLFIASRVLQGVGGGLLAGLGYAVIRSALPASLWLKAAGLISAMWGVGALIGPSLGGIFAELAAWRAAYGVLALIAVALGILSGFALPECGAARESGEQLPYLSLLALVLAAASFSLSPVLSPLGFGELAIWGGVVLLAVFLLIEWRAKSTVLPRAAFERGNPLKWVYLLVATLCAGVMVETYVPLFGQKLAGLSPLWAGFLGAALSLGWTGSQLFSVRMKPRAAAATAIAAPIVLTLAMIAYGFLQQEQAGWVRIAIWAVVLVIAGSAIGAAFPHLSVRALSSSSDSSEGQKAAAALSTTQLVAYALVSALLGVFAAGAPEGDTVGVAARISFGLAALTGAGVVAGTLLLVASRRWDSRASGGPGAPQRPVR